MDTKILHYLVQEYRNYHKILLKRISYKGIRNAIDFLKFDCKVHQIIPIVSTIYSLQSITS